METNRVYIKPLKILCSNAGYNGLQLDRPGHAVQSARPTPIGLKPVQTLAKVQHNLDTVAVQ